MIAKSQHTIAESVASEIRRNFFTKTFETELCIIPAHNETSVEANDIAADKEVESFNGHCLSLKLSLLGQIWLHIQSDGLAQEFSKWLVGEYKKIFHRLHLHEVNIYSCRYALK